MAGLVPIPQTRISQLLARERLLAQLQNDQLDLVRLQEQVSTGRRITLPSEDAPAAQRAMTLQRLLERKEQLRSNVTTGQSFLAASDNALTDVATLLGSIRGAALGVAGTTASDLEREQVAGEVNNAINTLVGIGNRRYLGRFLFAGSQTNIQPYSNDDGYVRYAGNTKLINDYSDVDVLFATNATGHSVFGGLSAVALGANDLNPQLTADTLLSSLRGGHGISQGAVQVSDGTSTVVVDLSRAVTVGDVVRLIEANAPAGRTLTASVTGHGLTLQLDSVGGGSLTVREVGSGTVASELGILETAGVLTAPLVGDDLDPIILKTTQIGDLMGSRARARLVSAGDNNDLLIEASANGAGYNAVTVQFVDDVAAGSEFAVFSAVGGTLTVHIDAGVSSANAVATAINAQGTFRAEIDPADTGLLPQAGTGSVGLTATAVTAGGSGTTLDMSGIRVVNGGRTQTISFAGAQTVEDLLNILNAEATGLVAEINDGGDGVNIRSRVSGGDFQIGENGGQTATQLGLRTYTGATRLDELNFGVGVPVKAGDNFTITQQTLSITTRSGQSFTIDLSTSLTQADAFAAMFTALGATVDILANPGGGFTLVDNTVGTGELQVRQSGNASAIPGGVPLYTRPVDFSITARNGVTHHVSLIGAQTVQDAINLINTATGGQVVASLAAVGNGIQLTDVTGGTGSLTVTSNEASQAAELIGLVPDGTTTNSTPGNTLVGADRRILETSSVFTTLIRLREALNEGDINAIERAIGAIDEDINRASFAHAEIGAREQALDVTKRSLEDEDVQLQSALADEIDVDLVEAISNLTARQTSLQASLQSMANMLQLSLLNFLD